MNVRMNIILTLLTISLISNHGVISFSHNYDLVKDISERYSSFKNNMILKNVSTRRKIPNFKDLARQNGKFCESFEVTTVDGYILTLFHIPGDAKKPVLLMHGFMDSADTFILRGNTSLSITLANQGYDVWVGSKRGSRYGRKHKKYNPDMDKKFWDFSFHEMGYYDLPATIDFVLRKTGQTSLSAVGHSEGAAIFFVLGSMKPEYNKKVRIFIALAPAVYLHNMKGLFGRYLWVPPRKLDAILKQLGIEELFGHNSIETSYMRRLCSTPDVGYEICARNMLFKTEGASLDDFESKFSPTYFQHYPAGSSRRSTIHLFQSAHRKKFAMYDYGRRQNRILYGSPVPPEYPLRKVTMNVALYVGKNDYLVTIKDVELLKIQIPNVVEYRIIEKKTWNHADFTTGRTMADNLFPMMLNLLKQYNQ